LKVQFGTQTLGMFNLVSKLFKRVYFGTFRQTLHNVVWLLLRWHYAGHMWKKHGWARGFYSKKKSK